MPSSIKTALTLLKNGHTIGFPTETVYGLAAIATNTAAVQKIFDLKNRPAFNPLIAHVSNTIMAKRYVKWPADATQLANAFWPPKGGGALTIILPLRQGSGISPLVTAGLNTLAVRCPAHPTAQEILCNLDQPLAAPSANPSGCISPTRPEHVQRYFPGLHVVDGGICQKGLESTIVLLRSNTWQVLRQGTVTEAEIERVLKKPSTIFAQTSKPLAPGQFLKHYAPQKPVRLNIDTLKSNEGLLSFGKHPYLPCCEFQLSADKNLAEAAYNLYQGLITLDNDDHCSAIAVMPMPNKDIGCALNDRLKRAAVN